MASDSCAFFNVAINRICIYLLVNKWLKCDKLYYSKMNNLCIKIRFFVRKMENMTRKIA